MNIISEAFQKYSGKLALSFNGGKDNMVVLDLITKYLNGHPDQSINTIYIEEEQFPELTEHCAKIITLYDLNPINLTDLSLLKETNPNIEAIFMGTRRSDPNGGSLSHFSRTTPGWPEYTLINPILDFSYSQVWHYLISENLPVCSLYSQGYTSLGCPRKTKKNPKLKVGDAFLPAWYLECEEDERLGRY